MNFETMSRQRKWMIISAAVGIIGIFLPWTKGLYYLTGQSANNNGFWGAGIVVFFCFVIAGALCLMGDQTKPLNRSNWMGALILAAVAFIIMAIKFFAVTGEFEIVGFGFYITIAGSIGLLYSTYAYRSADDNLSRGFDSLKETINAKTNAGNAPTQANPPAGSSTTTTVSTQTTVAEPTKPAV